MSNSSVEIWMPLYIGDVLKETMSLSAEEFRAYLLIQMHCWGNGGFISNDKETLKNVARMSPKKMQKVLALFVEKNGQLHHERTNELLIEARENKEKKRQQTEAATRARWRGTQSDTQSVTESVTHSSLPSSLALPTPSSLSPEIISMGAQEKSSSHIIVYDDKEPPGFSEFIDLYPKTNCSRKEALQSYRRVLTKGITQDTIIAGVKGYVRFIETTGTILAHPTSWLNNERWTIDYDAAIASHQFGRGNRVPSPLDVQGRAWAGIVAEATDESVVEFQINKKIS